MRVTDFKLAVQGVTTTAVQLLGFRVIDVKRGPALHGTDIISTDGCGPAPEAGFDIVLGRNPPVITPVSGLDNGAAKKIPFPFVVSSTAAPKAGRTALISDRARGGRGHLLQIGVAKVRRAAVPGGSAAVRTGEQQVRAAERDRG